MVINKENSTKLLKVDLKSISIIIGFLVLFTGLITQWVTYKTTVAELEKGFNQLQSDFNQYKEKVDQSIVNLKINVTSSDANISIIKEDISEIKQDIKKLLRNK